MSKVKPDFSQILSELPPIIPRKNIPEYLGRLISVGTLENLDAQGLGPKRLKIGKNIVYTREALIEWLNDRAKSLD